MNRINIYCIFFILIFLCSGWILGCGDDGAVSLEPTATTQPAATSTPVSIPTMTMTTEFRDINMTEEFNSIAFQDLNTGYIAGEDWSIYRTSDGGVTWKQVMKAPVLEERQADWEDINSIEVSDGGGEVIAVGERGFIRYSYDGYTWYLPKDETSGGLKAAKFSGTNPNTAGAVGGDGIVTITHNSGKNWEFSELEGSLTDIEFYSGKIWVIGDGKFYTSSDGKVWTEIKLSDNTDYLTSTNFKAIKFCNESQRGYVVGESGVILETKDGGETWHKLSNADLPRDNYKDNFIDILILNESGKEVVYFITDQGTVYSGEPNPHFSGETIWYEVCFDPPFPLGITIKEGEGFGAGSDILLYASKPGTSWKDVSGPPGSDITLSASEASVQQRLYHLIK